MAQAEMVVLTESEKLAFQAFLAAYGMVTRKASKDLAAKTNLTLDQYDVLVTLEYQPDFRLRLSDLAERVLLSRSGLTRLIDRLEGKGWVRRETCSEDKRGFYAVLTEDGQKAREEAWPCLRAIMKEHFCDKFEGHEQIEQFKSLCFLLATEHGFCRDVLRQRALTGK